LITSTAAVIDGQVYFAAGKTVYDLKAADGSLVWKHVICGNPDESDCEQDLHDPTQIFSSPAVSGGLVFIGHTPNGTGYRGAIEALDAATGAQRWRFEVDPIIDTQGKVIGGYNQGCGAVWSSAAVDPDSGLVFFGTGDCHRDPTPPYHESILALNAADGALVSVFRPSDVLNGCDQDFGASPNLITTEDGRLLLGEGGKDGTYYLLSVPKLGLVSRKNVVFGGSTGGFFGASIDGERIYAATAVGDGNIYNHTGLCDPSNPADMFLQDPSMYAFDLKDNGINVVWQGLQNYRINIAWNHSMNHSFAPTSVAAGVVFSGLVGIDGFWINAYDTQSGRLLVQLPMPGSVNSAATPIGKYLFVTAGSSADGSGGGVFAFALPLTQLSTSPEARNR
jgi:outer membrane protein assembly factor BamB